MGSAPPVLSDKRIYTIQELSALWDIDEPKSIPKVVPQFVADEILAAYKSHPHLFIKNEHELLTIMAKEKANPTASDRRLRLSFWEEYGRICARSELDTYFGRAMNMENVARGVCSKSYLTGTYLKNPYKVAFMVCQPASYIKAMEESISFGIDQMREILEMDNMVETFVGSNQKSKRTKMVPNIRLMELKAKIVISLIAQQKGSVVNHNINQKSLSVSANVGTLGPDSLGTIGGVTKELNNMSMEEIDRKLKQLEMRARKQSDLMMLEGDKEKAIETSLSPNPPTTVEADEEDSAVEELL
jgi:hypothetical protein